MPQTRSSSKRKDDEEAAKAKKTPSAQEGRKNKKSSTRKSPKKKGSSPKKSPKKSPVAEKRKSVAAVTLSSIVFPALDKKKLKKDNIKTVYISGGSAHKSVYFKGKRLTKAVLTTWLAANYNITVLASKQTDAVIVADKAPSASARKKYACKCSAGKPCSCKIILTFQKFVDTYSAHKERRALRGSRRVLLPGGRKTSDLKAVSFNKGTVFNRSYRVVACCD